MWHSRGHRGDVLENLIDLTHDYYHQLGLCRVDKISTPIKVIDINDQGMITKAFFEKKSTIDFIGIVQGVCVAFDAKETHLKSLPLSNIHPHQIDYMRDITRQGGLAFIIVHFKFNDSYFLIPFELIEETIKAGKRQSIPFKDIPPEFQIKCERAGTILNYIPTLNTYMTFKENLSHT